MVGISMVRKTQTNRTLLLTEACVSVATKRQLRARIILDKQTNTIVDLFVFEHISRLNTTALVKQERIRPLQ